jgi:ATP-dependent Clp protease ATP-binding subunit ClpA
VFNVLLQVLDDGRLTDSQGRTVDFKNTVVIMTSNIGSAAIATTGARAGDDGYDQMKRDVTEALRAQFRPEFLNRIDEVIVFHALTDVDLTAIVDLLVADLAARLEAQDLVLDLTPSARALIVRDGTDPSFGARPLKRTIQRLVENPVARALVGGEFKPGDRITADADPVGDTLLFSTADATVVADGSRRDARTAPSDAEVVGAGSRSSGSSRSDSSSPLDLPPTRRSRDDGGELVN